MTKREYITGVMRRMNELGWDDSLPDMFLGGDTTKVEKHVEYLFRDSWRDAVGLLPWHFFNQASFKDSTHVCDVSVGTGFVVLPTDFYMFVSFKMDGWKKSCYSAVVEDDSVARVQSNSAVRGNFCRPVCTLSERVVYTNSGLRQERVLNYYSLPCGVPHHIEVATYIPFVGTIDLLADNADLGLNELLYEPLQWINAGKVFSVFEKKDIAETAVKEAMKLVV